MGRLAELFLRKHQVGGAACGVWGAVKSGEGPQAGREGAPTAPPACDIALQAIAGVLFPASVAGGFYYTMRTGRNAISDAAAQMKGGRQPGCCRGPFRRSPRAPLPTCPSPPRRLARPAGEAAGQEPMRAYQLRVR